jgi:hypothetical protein
MKHLFTSIAALTLMGSGLVPALKADEWDKKTIITIDRSIDIQGTVLPPGSYVMKLLAGSVDRHTVQIFNVEQNRFVATIMAIPAWKIQPSDNTAFTFYEPAGGRPPALHTWFYPGDNDGLEFIKPR